MDHISPGKSPTSKPALEPTGTLPPEMDRAPGDEVTDAALSFLAPAQQPDEIGRLGPYRILAVLGQGGMGMVFKAQDPALDRLCALKTMLPEVAKKPEMKERFLREARAAAQLEHDHIIPIYQVDEDRGVPYIAMPFLKGASLEDWFKQKQKGQAGTPLTEPQILKLGREIARGLAAAHERGLVHRDIKPANIWLDATVGGRVKILDFGLARLSEGTGDQQLTQSGTILGTPAYMAPEQAQGQKLDGRADLFSLGVVLYRLCTGELPFKGDNPYAVLSALALIEPPSVRELNPALSPALAELVRQMLVKNPAQRIASARDVVQKITAIERSLAGSSAAAAANPSPERMAESSQVVTAPAAASAQETGKSQLPAGTGSEPTRSYRGPSASSPARRRWPLLVGAASLLVGLLLGSWIIFRDKGGKEGTPAKAADGGSAEAVPPVKGPNPNPPLPRPPNQRPVVSLLPLVELHRDTVKGKWASTAEGLLSDRNGVCVLEFPYRPPSGEYDFRLDFTCQAGRAEVNQFLARGDRSFSYVMGANVDKFFGLEMINGKACDEGPTVLTGSLSLNKRHRCTVHVRNEFVAVEVDGTELTHWMTDYSDLGLDHPQWKHWVRRDRSLLAFACKETQTLIHQAEVVEIAGQGIHTRPGKHAAPSPAAIDLLAGLKPQRDAIEGQWELKDGALVARTLKYQAGYARIPLPTAGPLPAEYDLHLEIERRSDAGNGVTIGVVMGGRQGTVVVDGYSNPRSWAVEMIDGKPGQVNGTRVEGEHLRVGQRRQVIVEVRRDRLRALCDGKPVLEWVGKAEQLGVWEGWSIPDKQALSLGAQTDVVFHQVRLVPWTFRTIAEWAIRRGGTVWIGDQRDIAKVEDLPPNFGRLLQVNLKGIKDLDDQDLTTIISWQLNNGLNLDTTNVTDASLRRLAAARIANSFGVAGTAVTGDGFDAWAGYPIGTLVVNGCRISHIGWERISRLGHLSRLYANSCPLSDESLAALAGRHPELELLNLDGTQLTDAGIEHLLALKQLRFLSFRDTAVSDEAVPKLAKLTSLKSLGLRNTKLSAAGIDRLRKALPQTTIE